MRALLGERTMPEGPHQLQFLAASDEGAHTRGPLGRCKGGLDGEPRLDRRSLPFRVDRVDAVVADRVAGRAVRLDADDQAPRGRRALESRRGVDDVARRERAAVLRRR